MPIKHFLQKAEKLEVQSYQKPKNKEELIKTHVPFLGSAFKHPSDPERILILSDPYSPHRIYYEFKKSDIAFVEDQPHLVSPDGEALGMVCLWVKKMAVAVRCTPFLVEDIRVLSREKH